MLLYLHIILFSAGILCLAAAVAIGYYRFKFIKKMTKAHGVVIKTAGLWSRHDPDHRVTVLMDPAHPHKAAIEGFFSIWVLTFLLGALGCALVIAGFVAWNLAA